MSKIAVIGGGYTGLVVALRLAQAGHKVTVLEASTALGGLASGFKIEGSSLERAYHHIFKTDKDIISLAEELGIGDKISWHESSLSIYYGGKMYPFMTAKDLLLFKPLSLINRIRAGLVTVYLQKTSDWHKFEKLTAYEWMRKWSGKQVTDVIWGPLLKGKFHSYYDQISMTWLWARINTRGNSRDRADKEELLGYFDGGFQVFTDRLVDELRKCGVKIETNVTISSVRSATYGCTLTFSDGKKNDYEFVVATTPSYVLGRLIEGDKKAPPAYIKKLNSIGYLGAVLCIFSSSQELSKYYWHNINDTKLPFLVFINQTRLIDKSIFKNKYIYYIGAYLKDDHHLFTASDKELEKVWFSGLKRIFPSFDPKKIHEKYYFRFRNAQHLVTTDYAKKIPNYKTPLSGLYLANFSQIYPEDRGTNFAVKEGQKVAEMVIKAAK